MIARKVTRHGVRGGFTLMEMMVVVAIIVVLAGVGGFYMMRSLDDAKRTAAKAAIQTLTSKCQQYELNNNGNRPPSLDALLQGDENSRKPYLDDPKNLNDPWGNRFQYDAAGGRNNGTKPDIWTRSPDGIEIGNWPGAK